MWEITNKNRFPVPIMVLSRKKPNSFTTLNVPGVGGGKNVYLLEDERMTENIKRAESKKLISVRHIPNKRKGE